MSSYEMPNRGGYGVGDSGGYRQQGGGDLESQQKLVQSQQPSGNLDFPDFLSQISSINSAIQNLSGNVSRIASLHNQTLKSYDTGSTEAAQLNTELEQLVSETSTLNNQLRDEIKFLERDSKFPGDPQGQAKRQQVDKLKKSFDSELKNYQLMESQYRGQYHSQMERQYRIVKPDATDEEVEKALESGETQVFSQALLSSSRSSTAQSINQAVKARHAEIIRIERTLIELLGLFEDMAREVEAAEPIVQQIEEQTFTAHNDVTKGTEKLKVATNHALNKKRGKWILLGLVLLILLIAGIALGVRFGGNKAKDNSNPPPTAARMTRKFVKRAGRAMALVALENLRKV